MNNRKMTPLEISRYIMEDPHTSPNMGVPAIVNQPGTMPGMGNNEAPGFGDGTQMGQDPVTVMNSCGACCCTNNIEGYCKLETIEINDTGGCVQYEASAEDSSMGQDGRYEEEHTDVSGMPEQGAGPQSNVESQDSQGRHWDKNRWDPKGGGY